MTLLGTIASFMLAISFGVLSYMFLKSSKSELGPVSAPLKPVFHLLGLLFAAHTGFNFIFVLLCFFPGLKDSMAIFEMSVSFMTFGAAYILWEKRSFLNRVLGRG